MGNSVQAAFAVATPTGAVIAEPVLEEQPSVAAVIKGDRKAIETELGRKLKFKERVALKVLKYKLTKQLKQGASQVQLEETLAEGRSQFSFGAFALGFLLGLIGVLIAYVFMDKSKAKYSWVGLGALLLIVILAGVL